MARTKTVWEILEERKKKNKTPVVKEQVFSYPKGNTPKKEEQKAPPKQVPKTTKQVLEGSKKWITVMPRGEQLYNKAMAKNIIPMPTTRKLEVPSKTVISPYNFEKMEYEGVKSKHNKDAVQKLFDIISKSTLPIGMYNKSLENLIKTSSKPEVTAKTNVLKEGLGPIDRNAYNKDLKKAHEQVRLKEEEAVEDEKLEKYNNLMKEGEKLREDPLYFNYVEKTETDPFDNINKNLNTMTYEERMTQEMKAYGEASRKEYNIDIYEFEKYNADEQLHLKYLYGKYIESGTDEDKEAFDYAIKTIQEGGEINKEIASQKEAEKLRNNNYKADTLKASEKIAAIKDSYKAVGGIDKYEANLKNYINKGVVVNGGMSIEQAKADLKSIEDIRNIETELSIYDFTKTPEEYDQLKVGIDEQIRGFEQSKQGKTAKEKHEIDLIIEQKKKEKDNIKVAMQISNNQRLTDEDNAFVHSVESTLGNDVLEKAKQGKIMLEELTSGEYMGVQVDPLIGIDDKSFITGLDISSYSQMPSEDQDKFYAIVVDHGLEKANKWLDIKDEEYFKAKAKADSEEIINMPEGFTKGAAVFGNDVMAGAGEFFAGGRNAIKIAMGETRSSQPTVENMIRQEVRPYIAGAMGVTSDIIYNVSRMIPAVTLSAINPLLGTAFMATSSFGNAANQALAEGKRYDESVAYGLLTAVSETATQMFLGGVAKTSKGFVSSMQTFVTKAVKNPKIVSLLNMAVNQSVNSFGEFAEEYLQEIITPVFRNLAFGENNEVKLLSEDALYEGLLAALTSAGLKVANVGTDYKNGVNRHNAASEIANGEIGSVLNMSFAEVYEALGNPTVVKSKVKALPEGLKSVISDGKVTIGENVSPNARLKYEVLSELKEEHLTQVYAQVAKHMENQGMEINDQVIKEQQFYLSKNIPVSVSDARNTVVAQYVQGVLSGKISLGDVDSILKNQTAFNMYKRSVNGIGNVGGEDGNDGLGRGKDNFDEGEQLATKRGRATVIKKLYTGKTPKQSQSKNVKVEIHKSSLEKVQKEIYMAQNQKEKSFKGFLTSIYNTKY